MRKVVDISRCDQEPVAFIGTVQSYGAMLVIETSSLAVVGGSENLKDFLGKTLQDLKGKKIRDIFPEAEDFFEKNPGGILKKGELLISRASAGRHELYEFQKGENQNRDIQLINYLADIQAQSGLKNLLQKSAEVVLEETNFSRVMIYKFHEDLHGEVIAEARKKGIDSFLGLHYPASDIPEPARKLFLKKIVRVIPDVSDSPIPIIADGQVDLSNSFLRSASPIHIEYLKNMNVGASLTISLVVKGKLWGLIACHNDRPKILTPAQREACEIIGRMVASHINEAERTEESIHKERVLDVHRTLIKRISNTEDMSNELTKISPTIIDLIDAGGASAALYIEGHWVTVGKVPPESELEKLTDWLSVAHPNEVLFHTHELSKHYPDGKAIEKLASGLMALWIPKGEKNYILWFRPEVITTVNWAGNPNEKVFEVNGRLSPRGSFDLWKESVGGTAVKWKPWELDAALELRNAINALDLRKQYDKEMKARIEAEQAVRSREELVEVVSHDLRNPLTSILMNTKLMEKLLPPDQKLRDTNARISRSVKVMNDLIEDILTVTKMESGNVTLDVKKGDLATVIRDAVELLAPIAIERQIQLNLEEKVKVCEAKFDEGRILQVLSNLIGNALKFTPEGGTITVWIEKCGAEFVKVCVKDSGPGIPHEHLPNIFDRFWQAQHTKKMGTGLGLSIVRGIIRAHGGDIEVESDIGKGTTFKFTIPLY